MSMRQTIRKIINEDNKMREPIRKIVRDIITVFKFEDEGEFFLPEYFDERESMTYDFLGLNPFSVEVIIDYGNYGVNAYYSRDDETIVVKIIEYIIFFPILIVKQIQVFLNKFVTKILSLI